MDTKAKEAAEKAAKEKAELEAKEAAEKAAKKFKKTYEVAITGFYALGKMFRGREKISSNQYKDHIEKWLKEGKIR